MKNKTRTINVGRIAVGGENRLTVQTMWKRSLHNVTQADVNEILSLQDFGCDIIRFSVPDMKSAGILKNLKPQISIPVVADIHFDYKIALECINNGIDKIRINPGNIGPEWKVREVLTAASDSNIPIRVGINSGSLPETVSGLDNIADAMIKAAEKEIEILEKMNFRNAVFSLKASDIENTITANEEFSQKWDYPLHIGITEAGPGTAGTVKSSIAFYRLLEKGIGDTIRVSLTDTPLNEVITGREILKACGKSNYGVDIISCPRCGRSTFNTTEFINRVYSELYLIKKPLKIAVMGCIVNGPGEALHADLGITGSGKKAVIFKHGKIIRKVDENNSIEAFLEELKALDSEV